MAVRGRPQGTRPTTNVKPRVRPGAGEKREKRKGRTETATARTTPALATAYEKERVETEIKYAGYITRQADDVARVTAQAGLLLPATLDYATIPGLRTEAREKLGRVRPETLGQAGRMAGVNPADVAILLVHVERERRRRRRRRPSRRPR